MSNKYVNRGSGIIHRMIDQIEDKEAKAKYIRKVLEQQNTKSKSHYNLANSYKMKHIIQYFKKQEPATVQDLQLEIKQMKTQIDELKLYTHNIDVRIKKIPSQIKFLRN